MTHGGKTSVKCPNCGLEVVIATDMCPQCGYHYNFDGSILPKTEPTARDEESARPEPRRRRDEGEESSSARWTRAGVYTDGTDAKRRINEGAVKAQRGMRWYQFVINVALPLTGVFCFIRGVSEIMDAVPFISYTDILFMFAPWMPVLWIICGLVYIGSGIAAFAARKLLARFEWKGVGLYIVIILAPNVTDFVSRVITMAYLDYYTEVFSLTVQFVVTVLYAVCTGIYFARRRDMFN